MFNIIGGDATAPGPFDTRVPLQVQVGRQGRDPNHIPRPWSAWDSRLCFRACLRTLRRSTRAETSWRRKRDERALDEHVQRYRQLALAIFLALPSGE